MISSTTSPASQRGSLFRRFVTGVALVALCTCNLTRIDVSVGGQGTIPMATIVDMLLGPVAFTGFDKIDFTMDFANQGVTKDEVDAVALKSFSLTIDAPSGQTFDFIQSITIYAQTSVLDKMEIASLAQVPKGSRQLELTVAPNVDLKSYVVAPSMQIAASVQGSRPMQDTTVSAKVVLTVDVHIPGC